MTADAEFLLSKARYKAATGRELRRDADVLCYQIRQSFKPREITPEASGFTVKHGHGGVISFLVPGQERPIPEQPVPAPVRMQK